MNGPYAIETAGLGRRYGAVTAVGSLDLRVPAGSIYGFLGPNGAGKTTTIKMLLGLTRPSAGRAMVLGHDPQRDGLAVRRRTGFVSEGRGLYDHMTVAELLRFCRALADSWDDRVAERYLDLFGLPRGRRVATLSGGMKSQLALVIALGPRPQLLLLDEPTSGLDPLMRRDFLTTLVEQVADTGQTVFISSHILSEVERIADWVGMLRQGRLVAAGPLDDLKQRQKRVRVVFQQDPGVDLAVLPGVQRVERQGRACLLTVAGHLEELLACLQAEQPLALEVLHLGLEEIFLDYAGGGGQ